MSAELRMEFTTASGATKKMTIKRIDEEVPTNSIKSLVAEITENGEFLWADAPETCTSAILRVISDTAINISD